MGGYGTRRDAFTRCSSPYEPSCFRLRNEGMAGLHVTEQIASALLVRAEPALVPSGADGGEDRGEVDRSLAEHAPLAAGVVLQMEVIDHACELVDHARDVRFAGPDQVSGIERQAEA